VDRRIIVGYDGRDPALDAVALGRLLAETTGAGLSLLIALPYDASLIGDRYEQALEEDSERLLARARPLLDGMRFETRVYGGESAPRLLNDIAESARAELLVLGSTHRGPMGRLLPGSVAERLLAGSPCAVAVAPRGFANRAQQRIHAIGVGYDGSEEARGALAVARDLAKSTGARLTLYGVVEPPGLASSDAAWMAASVLSGAGPEFETVREREIEHALSDALAELPEGVPATTQVVTGDPAQALIERSGDDVDLLLVGSRRYGPVRRVLLGDVSGKVMRSASCPVIVVPRGSSAG
jgi:nucleotide-binding universal stress UspA family protein